MPERTEKHQNMNQSRIFECVCLIRSNVLSQSMGIISRNVGMKLVVHNWQMDSHVKQQGENPTFTNTSCMLTMTRREEENQLRFRGNACKSQFVVVVTT